MSKTIIYLNDEEQSLASRYGYLIYENKLKNGIVDRKIGNKDAVFYDIMGISGEMAVHKHFGLPYNIEIYLVRDRVDITVGKYALDIKTSFTNVLKVPKFQNNKFIDGYLLVTCDKELTTFTIQGIISKNKFSKLCTINGDWKVLNSDLLNNIEKLNY